jgi:hypothetical protein
MKDISNTQYQVWDFVDDTSVVLYNNSKYRYELWITSDKVNDSVIMIDGMLYEYAYEMYD